MDNWRIQLKIPPSVVDRGHQLYKLASNANFVQGRRIDQVAAVCLYSAHRQHENGCNTMLIDYADKLGVRLFYFPLFCCPIPL
jgi:transcription factor IIIB subunit 2